MTPNEAPGLGPIMQLLVPVDDVERATAFYEDVLGLPLLFKYPGNAFFDAHGVRIYLAKPTEPGYAGPITIYFRVDDVAATFDRLVARGAAVREAPRSRIVTSPTTCGSPSSATSTGTTSG